MNISIGEIREMSIPPACKGCRTYDVDGQRCFYQIYTKHIQCPCQKCLIKSICNTPCEEFNKAEIKWNEKSRIEVWACKGKPFRKKDSK